MLIFCRSFEAGQEVKLDAAETATVLGHGDAKMKIFNGATVKLANKTTMFGEECAVFDISFDMNLRPYLAMFGAEKGAGKGTLAGKIVVGINTAWCYKIDLEGDTKVAGKAKTKKGDADTLIKVRVQSISTLDFALPPTK